MWTRLPLVGAEVDYVADAIARDRSDRFFEELRAGIPWQRHRLRIFGREVDAPRLSAWIGDPGAVYTYSRTRFVPQPWTPQLAALRAELASRFGLAFNAVLANRYRSGDDAMGWHSDDERELGAEPVIASLSFGASRRLRFRSRTTRKVACAIDLEHGSLLVMRGATQRLYQHDLPRTRAAVGERINLTFRTILAEDGA